MSKERSRREGTGRKDQREEIPPDPREVIWKEGAGDYKHRGMMTVDFCVTSISQGATIGFVYSSAT